MIGLLAPYEYRQYRDATGAPLSGGKIYTYAAGGTTPATTWTTSTITGGSAVPNANPITLDSAGCCTIFLDPSLTYRFIGKTSGGTTVFDQDNIAFPNVTPTTQNIVLNRASSTATGTQNNYDLNALSTNPGVKVSYLQWKGAAACTLTGLDGITPTSSAEGYLLVIDNITSLTAGFTLTLKHQSASSAAANRFTSSTGADLVLQAGQRAIIISDYALLSSGPLRATAIYCPAAPTNQTLSTGTIYLSTGITAGSGIAANPWTGQLQIDIKQTNGADAGGTVQVVSDSATPPTVQRGYWNYGPGVAQQTFVIDILNGNYFKVNLTGSAVSRTVTLTYLGGAVT